MELPLAYNLFYDKLLWRQTVHIHHSINHVFCFLYDALTSWGFDGSPRVSSFPGIVNILPENTPFIGNPPPLLSFSHQVCTPPALNHPRAGYPTTTGHPFSPEPTETVCKSVNPKSVHPGLPRLSHGNHNGSLCPRFLLAPPAFCITRCFSVWRGWPPPLGNGKQ